MRMTRRQLQALKKSLPHGGQAKALRLLRREGKRFNRSSVSKVLDNAWENPDIIRALIVVRDQHRATMKALERAI